MINRKDLWLFVLILVVGAVVAFINPRFLTGTNLLIVTQQSSINIVLAAGMTFVILTGGIDLSVGSILAASAMMAVLVSQIPDWGLLGVIYAHSLGYITTGSVYRTDNSLNMIVYSLLGGMGTLIGPIIGAPVMVVLTQVVGVTLNTVEANLRTEELLKQSQILFAEAQEASKSKSAFLSMAAHELRTPLSVIIGYLSMLQDGTLTPDRWERPLQVLMGKATELNRIVDDLLTAARIEGGTVLSIPNLVDLRDLDLDEVVADLVDPLGILFGREVSIGLGVLRLLSEKGAAEHHRRRTQHHTDRAQHPLHS